MYRTLVRPEWKTLELLENVEHTIHSVVRARYPGAVPAQIACVRIGPNEAVLTYTSARRMCPVAKGIVKGLGTAFQQVSIDEASCMQRGSPACRMTIRVS